MTERASNGPEYLKKSFTGKSYEEVREVKDKYCEELEMKGKFGTEVTSVGLSVIEHEKSWQYAVSVGFTKGKTPEELASLPQELEGIPLKYSVIGVVYSQKSEKKFANIFKRRKKSN